MTPTKKGAEESYRAMERAYERIFTRCGLKFRQVQAPPPPPPPPDSGDIGGSFSAEFMVLADSGEDAIVSCDSCNYAANMEKATMRNEAPAPFDGELLPTEKVETPKQTTIEDVAAFLKIDTSQLVKTLILEADGKPVAVLLRGDHDLNDIKLQRYLNADNVEMATPEVIQKVTGAPVGFAGPIDLSIPIIADKAVLGMHNFVVGGNAEDLHIKNVNIDRDFKVGEFVDLRNAMVGDGCPVCDGHLIISRGIEVGHIFKLGDKYSKAMKAEFLDENGELQPMVMGCYGIGVGRTAASSVEQNHDKFGIIWPIPIAPFTVILTTIAPKDEVLEAADKLYQSFLDAGIEILYDDRDERPGVKFKDADLIGIPIRVTVGKKALDEGCVELKLRTEKDFEKVPVDQIIDKVKTIIKEAIDACD